MVEARWVLARLQADFPQLEFIAGQRYYWSPAKRQIFYVEGHSGPRAVYSLLHEAGHALLTHQRYSLDFELLEMEVAAWERAKHLADGYGIDVDEDHIQDCLDSYRDWLYRRSICPSCTTKALQQDKTQQYFCFNCQTSWQVSPSRFCRPYRSTNRQRQLA